MPLVKTTAFGSLSFYKSQNGISREEVDNSAVRNDQRTEQTSDKRNVKVYELEEVEHMLLTLKFLSVSSRYKV